MNRGTRNPARSDSPRASLRTAECRRVHRRQRRYDRRAWGSGDPPPRRHPEPVHRSRHGGAAGDRRRRCRAGDKEGYDLTIAPDRVTLRAATPAGLFYGIQTLRHLLPPAAEYEAIHFAEPRPAVLPAARIVDRPRFAWRGAMLDVARHFFTVNDVKRFIDLLALHKINRLHLHLTDDQGWRIEIRSWPELARRGGSTRVGGGPGGYYTQEQYAELVAYAAERFITIVPEIDLPGHTNAAISAYGELSESGKPSAPYTGIEVGFIALSVDDDVTDRFVDDVVRELAALTPGPYIHIGGDEVETLTAEQYRSFIARAQEIVHAHGKQVIGWDEVATAPLLPSTIVQHWRPDAQREELARMPRLILSPADRVYLDMKYDDATALGFNWAGNIPIRRAYDWDPAALIPDAAASAILGVEAPLWSETLATMRDIEFMAFPRLAAVADLAWAPASKHDWDAFKIRLAAQAPRWTALGINFHRAPEVQWKR
jgi:hexosaminidase